MPRGRGNYIAGENRDTIYEHESASDLRLAREERNAGDYNIGQYNRDE